MAKIAIVDTSPIVALVAVGHLGVLDDLFEEIILPLDVWNELAGKLDAPEPMAVMRLSKSRLIPVPAPDDVDLASLDRGERSVIGATTPSDDIVLLLDEKRGRRVAAARGFKVRGTLAVLLEAKREGLVAELAPLLRKLQESGFHLGEELIAHVLRAAGENAE